MPMAHNLPLMPSGIMLDGTEDVWFDKFVGGEWVTYRCTMHEIAALVSGPSLSAPNDWTANQYVTPDEIAGATGSVTLNAALSNNFQLTLTGNLTLANPTGLVKGMWLFVEFIEDATGGRTITLGSLFKFPGGTVPTWITTANAKNGLSAYYDGAVLLCNGGAGYA